MNVDKRRTLYTGEQVKAIDRAAIKAGTPGIVLMKRAGTAAFNDIIQRWPGRALCVICGGGNNGGDGYVVAALARQHAIPVTLYYAKPPQNLQAEAKAAAVYAQQEGVNMQPLSCIPSNGFDRGGHVIVDALLGTGTAGTLSNEYQQVIDWMNVLGAPVFSIDLPSGLSSDTGMAACACVKADATMSFIGRKRGLYTGDAPEYTGARLFDALDVEQVVIDSVQSNVQILDALHLRAKLSRAATAHKGCSGHVAVIGGEKNMAGAALMAAEACLYSGAGLTSLYTRENNIHSAQVRIPEVMACGVEDDRDFCGMLSAATVLCAGPGMGRTDWSKLILRDVLQSDKAKVLDADALNLIAAGQVALKGGAHVLTPHPGEAARLLGTDTDSIQANRFEAVMQLQKRYGGVILLKGAGTLISDGQYTWVNTRGNAGMAVGGMGDVLAGVIAALIAQGLSLLEAAQLGALVHSAAADKVVAAQGQIGLRATELFTELRSILNGKTDLPG